VRGVPTARPQADMHRPELGDRLQQPSVGNVNANVLEDIGDASLQAAGPSSRASSSRDLDKSLRLSSHATYAPEAPRTPRKHRTRGARSTYGDRCVVRSTVILT